MHITLIQFAVKLYHRNMYFTSIKIVKLKARKMKSNHSYKKAKEVKISIARTSQMLATASISTRQKSFKHLDSRTNRERQPCLAVMIVLDKCHVKINYAIER